jgi:hypothetical protein
MMINVFKCFQIFLFSHCGRDWYIVAEIGISEKIVGIWVGFRVADTLALCQHVIGCMVNDK